MALAVGGVTAVLGVLYALMEHDLKRLLAYHTVENIGIIFIGLGLALAFSANQLPVAAALGLTAALHPLLLLHGHVHPYGEAVPPRPLGDTMVRNVTGWHLLEVGPMMGPMMSTAAVQPLPGQRHAG